ncbi:MAG: flippase-like domain-containing protein [Candidatus Nanoarchaeia archaeon]
MKKRYQLVFLSLALLLLYFVLNKVGFNNIINTLKMLKWYYLVLAIALNLSMFLVWNKKWKSLVNKLGKIKFWELFPILMAGIFINTSTPTANVGGEPLRAYYLGKKLRKEKTKCLATIIIDKATNTATSLLFVVFSILFITLFLKIPTTVKILTQSLIIIAAIIIIVSILLRKLKLEDTARIFYPLFRKKFPDKKQFLTYIQNRIGSIKEVMKEFFKDNKAVKKEVTLALVMQLLTFAKAYVLFIALGQNVNPLNVVIAVSISMVVGQLILVPGGVGVIESSMISMYALMGINANIAATVAILDRIIYYFFALGVGYLSFSYLNYKHR